MPIVGNQDFNPSSQKIHQCMNQTGTEEKKQIIFVGREPHWNLDEIILNDETKNQLNDAVVYLRKKKTIVEEWNLKRFLKGGRGCTGINMYGKPGTGKSIAAEAIAKAAGMKIIKVDYSEIQNEKWGGTERQLTTLFKNASDTDSIIFFDEADSLLGKRQSEGANSETNNQIKAHLLTLLDEYDVVVLFATNLFENYDRAFFRRILFHISFPLPSKNELNRLWQFHLGSEEDTNKRKNVHANKTIMLFFIVHLKQIMIYSKTGDGLICAPKVRRFWRCISYMCRNY